MEPISFSKQEVIFYGDGENIDDLPVLKVEYTDGGEGLVSCWRASLPDLWRLITRRRIYLVVLGTQQPPVLLSTDKIAVGVGYYENAKRND